ncbi:MAG: alpha-E domain-containing protein, partial [Sphingomonas sp.]
RRNPGTLPSRVADNLFWLGRYLERGEALLGVVRALLGHSISADSGAALAGETVRRLVGLLVSAGAAPTPESFGRADLTRFAEAAMDSADDWRGVRAINRQARAIGAVSRDRLSADMIRLLDAPYPVRGSALDRAGSLQRRYSALAGLSAEHMGRTDAWRFHDLGRRVERAVTTLAALQALGQPQATSDDLSALLDLADSQISYRQRYLTGMARVPVLDLVALDPGNPRGVAFQVAAIGAHLAALPVLSDDGIAEPQQALAAELAAMVATAQAASLDSDRLFAMGRTLGAMSDALARRYFLHGSEPLRAAALVVG